MYKSMATKKRGLGQGIDSLIPNKVNANKETETVKVNAGSEKNETDGIFVNINKVEPNREQPRKNFDEDSLVDLSESIKQVGVCLLYTSPSPRDLSTSRMPSSA